MAKQYLYSVISLDLGSARSDTAQGLTSKINTLTVISLGGGSLSVKLNSSSNDSITLSDGQNIVGFPISELYWTNAAQVGITATIFGVWID